MVGDHTGTFRAGRRWAAVCGCALMLMLCFGPASAQPPPYDPIPPLPVPPSHERIVAEVRFAGYHNVTQREIQAQIMTRPGRPLDPVLVQKDVRALVTTHKFYDVKVRTQPGPAPGTVIVTFEVFEFPKLDYVRFVGNDSIKSDVLAKESGLKKGDPLSLSGVDDARKKIEEFYRSHGYNLVRIEVREGLSSHDRGAVFVIDEGPQQRIWSVNFVGPTFVSGARLKFFIDSTPSLLRYIRGYVDTRKIDEDVEKLTAYYRKFGFFRARVGRELNWDPTGTWLYLTFVIDEGPRFTIHSVSFSGNQLFSTDQLETLVDIKAGEFFDQGKMTKATTLLNDAYGSVGYVKAKIEASPRTLETDPQLDLVFEINEGSRYRVGRIIVNILGDNPHTRQEVVLNRLGFRSGDIADSRKIRDAVRRLQAAAVFATDPEKKPRIDFKKEGGKDEDVETAEDTPRSVRGQSPDNLPAAIPAAAPVTLWLYPEQSENAAAPTNPYPIPNAPQENYSPAPSAAVAPSGPYWAPAAPIQGGQQ